MILDYALKQTFAKNAKKTRKSRKLLPLKYTKCMEMIASKLEENIMNSEIQNKVAVYHSILRIISQMEEIVDRTGAKNNVLCCLAQEHVYYSDKALFKTWQNRVIILTLLFQTSSFVNFSSQLFITSTSTTSTLLLFAIFPPGISRHFLPLAPPHLPQNFSSVHFTAEEKLETEALSQGYKVKRKGSHFVLFVVEKRP